MSGRLVLFDLDGTLTHTDSTRTLAALLDGSVLSLRRRLVEGALVAARFRLISNNRLKQLFCRLLLAGRSVEEVESVANRFATEQLPLLQDPQSLGLLEKHRRNGDRVYLVSANFAALLAPLHRLWSLQGIVATETETSAGRLTGALRGRACHGREKLRRIRDAFDRHSLAAAIAYGDGRGDLPLLRAVGEGYLVCRNGHQPLQLNKVPPRKEESSSCSGGETRLV